MLILLSGFMLKQVIVIRRDLKLSPGKLAVQVAHASLEAYRRAGKRDREAWESSGAKKVVVKVEDLKTLLVGWPIDLPDVQEKGRPWFEDITPEEIEPQNIYHAQRRRRLLGAPQPGVPKAGISTGQPDGTRRERRRPQFRLWTLLAFLLTGAILFSWLAVKVMTRR